MIEEKKLIEQLNNLKQISPSADFASKLKGVIFSTQRPQKKVWGLTKFRLSVKEGLGLAVSVGFVAVLVALFLNVAPQALNNPVVGTTITPSQANASILNQADAAVNDINVHLAEVNTFDAVTEQSNSALSNINPTAITAEENKINSSQANDSEDASKIDDVLNQLSS